MIHDGYLEVVGAADENSSEETRTQPSCVRPMQLKCLTASTCHWRFPDAVTLLPRLPSFQAPLCTFPNLRFRCQSATGEGADFGLSGCQAWLRRASSQAQPVRDIKSSRLNVLIFFFFKWSSKWFSWSLENPSCCNQRASQYSCLEKSPAYSSSSVRSRHLSNGQSDQKRSWNRIRLSCNEWRISWM